MPSYALFWTETPWPDLRILHDQISGGDSILRTTFCGDHAVVSFCSMAHYDITIGNDVVEMAIVTS